MKTYLLFILTAALLVGCDNPTPKAEIKMSPEDSLKLAISDSTRKARQDSIRQVEAEREAYRNRPWKMNRFVDRFGDPSGDKYIKFSTSGKFSNSATVDSYLWVKIIVDRSDAGIFLHEYRADNPAETFISTGKIYMKNQAGKTGTVTSKDKWNESGGLRIWGYEYTKFKDFIAKSVGKVRVVINDEYSSKYEFTIDATGFIAEFNKI